MFMIQNVIISAICIYIPESYNFQKFSINLKENNTGYFDQTTNNSYMLKCTFLLILTPVSSFTSLTAPVKISSDWLRVAIYMSL